MDVGYPAEVFYQLHTEVLGLLNLSDNLAMEGVVINNLLSLSGDCHSFSPRTWFVSRMYRFIRIRLCELQNVMLCRVRACVRGNTAAPAWQHCSPREVVWFSVGAVK